MCIGEVEGAEILWANLVTGKGCGAPDRRLPCFEKMYNKEDFIEKKKRIMDQKAAMGHLPVWMPEMQYSMQPLHNFP